VTLQIKEGDLHPLPRLVSRLIYLALPNVESADHVQHGNRVFLHPFCHHLSERLAGASL
jgi:hypothetical protein